MSMRILHIIGSMDPRHGGPQEVVRMLLAYSPPDVSNEIATLDDPGSPFLNSSSLPIHPLGNLRKPGAWYSPRLMPWLRANRSRFDGVIHHGLWGFPGIATLHTIAGRRPYMVFVHGMLDPYFKRAFPTKHLKKWPFWLLNDYWLLRRAERALFTTAVERDLAPQSFPLCRWVPMVTAIGSEPPPFALPEAQAVFLAQYPQLAGRRFLLFLGRIHPKKGCDLLVQAFAETAGNDPALDLVMAGPDPDNWRPELEAIAARAGFPAGRIHWPGMLQGKIKWGAFAACEAFILTSHQENFGVAVVEALACGRPALLTEPINIAPDLIAARCAFVVPDTLAGARDVLALWLATPPAERAAMGERALTTFAERYDMRRNAAAVFASFPASSTSMPHQARPSEAH